MPSIPPPVLSLVVPCLNEEPVLPTTAPALREKLQDLQARGLIASGSRIYFIDDGSTDRTWSVISELAAEDDYYEGVKLSRNFGHQYAVYAGLMHAQGDAMVSIDADLQDDINAIDEMVERYLAGDEVVYGVRADRHSDGKFKRWSAEAHYWVSAKFGVHGIPNHADFRLMSKRAVAMLGQFRETNLYLRGVIPLLGLPSSNVYYTRSPRLAGETKYGLRDMVGLSVQGITSFSIVPLRIISILGLLVSTIAILLGVWAFIAALMSIEAWTPTGIPTYLLGGLQILSIGVVGEYIGKIYMEVKSRPTYLIETAVSRKDDSAEANE